MRTIQAIGLAVCLAAAIAFGPPAACAQDKLTIVVFGPPSLGAFLPPIIKAQKLDEKNGLSITFDQRTPDAYTAQFNSGEYQLGGSAALLTIGLADLRAVKVTYLFNLFDYWGSVVTSRKDVQTLKDLEGKDLAAAKGTTNYVMFEWLARQQGVDTSKISVINTATPGLMGYALADRASAVQLWEPAYTRLMAKNVGIRALDLKIGESWEKFAATKDIPYLGVAAHREWAEKNKPLVPKLYATYKAAADWVLAHPDEAAGWFHGIEFRIFFIMVLTTLPAFTFQVLGALRAMSKDLLEMVTSFRPTRGKLFRVMILPSILPDILTAWKVNLGNASRVVVVAELVGAAGGVGYQLLQQQQLFDMAGALAWTLQLVFFVLVVQRILAFIETVAFRYRAVSERGL